MPKILLIDTSVLFAVFEKDVPIDLSSIIELVHPKRIGVLSQCLKEIEHKMRYGSIRERSIARSLISTMEKLGIHEIRVEGPEACDEAIISYCKGKRDVVVATLDNELKNRLLKDGISVIYLRAGKKPVLEGSQI
ncbi:MAG TPA: hypothetical protein EYP68_03790 [Candidatus Korarchaeota archaeon]|nr:hypothetical protein [Candidatus Korarchaeota archaeon]